MLKDLITFKDGKYATRNTFERTQCAGKQAFNNRVLARKVAFRERRDGSNYEAYACKTCGLWHIGHQKLSDR